MLQPKGGVLAPVGQVSGLGQGEQIYSVRFIGDTGLRGHVPAGRPALHDRPLSTPTAPKVAGQLELAGYSAYLHPVGDGLLLGVGDGCLERDERAERAPARALRRRRRSARRSCSRRRSLGAGSSTQATYDHHAFLFWPPTGLAVLPMQTSVINCFAAPCATSRARSPSAAPSRSTSRARAASARSRRSPRTLSTASRRRSSARS